MHMYLSPAEIIQKMVKFASILCLSVCVTCSLILFMYHLVFIEFIAPTEKPDYKIPPISWETKEPTVIKDTRPKLAQTLEPPPTIETIEGESDAEIDFGSIAPVVVKKKSDIDFTMHSSDTPMALVLVAPRYPSSALARKIEGFVDVQFDVTETGSTKNIVVINAQPLKTFDRAAREAVTRWKFEPKMVEGKPVEFLSMVKRVRFEMEK